MGKAKTAKQVDSIALTDRQRLVMEQIANGNSLYEFLRNCWHVMEPGVAFKDNWHIEAICEHLEYVTAGLVRNLIINIPPRHAKSNIVAVAWPCWVWTFMPSSKWLFSAHTSSLSTRDSVRCRRLISSDWYRARYPEVMLSPDVNRKSRFDNTLGGSRFSCGVGGALLGEGGDFLVADDPNSPKHILTSKVRKDVIEWWNNIMGSRGNDPKTVCRVIIMQRLHQEDLCGELLATQPKDWCLLRIPLEYEPETHCKTIVGWEDPRTTRGELLWKGRYTDRWVQGKKDQGAYEYSAMFQQRPTPLSGGMFKVDKILSVTEAQLPPGLMWGRYYDLAYSVKSTGHYTATIACAMGPDGTRYFRGGYMEKMETPAIQDMIKRTMKQEPITLHGVEGKLHGAAIVQLLLTDPEISSIPLVAVSVESDKVTRASPLSTAINQDKVRWVESSPSDRLWIDKFVDQLRFFPFGKNDDAVDAMSGAHAMIAQRSTGEYATQGVAAGPMHGNPMQSTTFEKRTQSRLPTALGMGKMPASITRV